MSSRVAARSFGMGVVSAVAYEIVDTAAQYSNTSKQVLSFMTNGQLVLIVSGVLFSILGWYGLTKSMYSVSALGFELGPLFIVVAISNMIKNKMAASNPALGQIAQVRRVVAAPAPAPAPASGSAQSPIRSLYSGTAN